jgi:hypothetical protein
MFTRDIGIGGSLVKHDPARMPRGVAQFMPDWYAARQRQFITRAGRPRAPLEPNG